MDTTSLGDRQKYWEAMSDPGKINHLLPCLLRVDGKAFHTVTKQLNLEIPFDRHFLEAMDYITEVVAKECGAHLAYTQSDEISILFGSTKKFESQIMYDGKIRKICSLIAAKTSVLFYDILNIRNTHPNLHPMFDCRVWNVPSKDEAVNYFIWREEDAVRNSIQSMAHSNFSHKSLHGLSCNQLQEKLHSEAGINWNDLEPRFKRGRYIQRTTQLTKISKEELNQLPEKHEARSNPELEISRQIYRHGNNDFDMPQMKKIINRVEVAFHGEDPMTFGDVIRDLGDNIK